MSAASDPKFRDIGMELAWYMSIARSHQEPLINASFNEDTEIKEVKWL